MVKYRVAIAFLSMILMLFVLGCPVEQSDESIALPDEKLLPPQIETEAEIPVPEVYAAPTPLEKEEPNAPAVVQKNLIDLLHEKYAAILDSFVNENCGVDYAALRRKRFLLKGLLDEYKLLDPKEYENLSNQGKIAFWINVYNMQLINIIVDNYPIESPRWKRLWFAPDSIRHIEGDIEGIWSKRKFLVMDEEFTLKVLEDRFFRDKFNEPRVYFALSRASLSGPCLRNEPYAAGKLSEQLDDQVRKFLSNKLSFDIDRDEKQVRFSAILQSAWFGRQFVERYGIDKKFKEYSQAERAILNLLTNYLSEQDVRYLEVGDFSIKYIKYNWSLNDWSK